MYDPHSPIHHVTPHNQGAPCSLHPLTKQAETAETHFGVYPSTIRYNTNYTLPLSCVTVEENESNAPTKENSTNAYPAASPAAVSASEEGAS